MNASQSESNTWSQNRIPAKSSSKNLGNLVPDSSHMHLFHLEIALVVTSFRYRNAVSYENVHSQDDVKDQNAGNFDTNRTNSLIERQ